MDEDVRRKDIIDELGKLSDHQQYVDSLRGLNLTTIQPPIIVRSLNLLSEINNYLRVSVVYLASTYVKKALTGNVLEDQVASCKTALRTAIQEFNEAVSMEACFLIWKEADKRRRSEALDELTKLSYKKINSDYCRRRTKKTGQWLLDEPKFDEWINGARKLLWCPGIGKVFLLPPDLHHLFSDNSSGSGQDIPHVSFR